MPAAVTADLTTLDLDRSRADPARCVAGVQRTIDRPLHVAVVDEELPYPADSGKRLRTLNLLVRLARRHRITFLCRRNHAAEEVDAAMAYLLSKGIEPIVVETPSPARSVLSRGPSFYAGLAANLLSRRPYVVDVNDCPALRAEVRVHDRRQQVDLWQSEWTPYADVLGDIEPGRKLIIAHNIESQIWRRYEEHESRLLPRWYISHQRRKFERFERAAFVSAARVVAVSPEDAVQVRDQFDAPHVSVVENGVDLEYFHPCNQPRDPRTILFLGSLDWRPNLDAVDQLLTTIMPSVCRVLPDTKLWIVGRNPPVALHHRVREIPWASLHAGVADVRPYLWQCAIMAVPLRIGGGSRLKILEALATETPVVSTIVGAEGLRLRGGHELTTTQGVENMAAALIDALSSPTHQCEMARNGNAIVRAHYGWDSLADRLEQVWLSCVRERL